MVKTNTGLQLWFYQMQRYSITFIEATRKTTLIRNEALCKYKKDIWKIEVEKKKTKITKPFNAL